MEKQDKILYAIGAASAVALAWGASTAEFESDQQCLNSCESRLADFDSQTGADSGLDAYGPEQEQTILFAVRAYQEECQAYFEDVVLATLPSDAEGEILPHDTSRWDRFQPSHGMNPDFCRDMIVSALSNYTK